MAIGPSIVIKGVHLHTGKEWGRLPGESSSALDTIDYLKYGWMEFQVRITDRGKNMEECKKETTVSDSKN